MMAAAGAVVQHYAAWKTAGQAVIQKRVQPSGWAQFMRLATGLLTLGI